ncbi:hypothetical protein [Geomonas azotofigens]|uniref:hypothetical protein n=1 Tax=Geomonas azotofigens TaxID=2843196 RepID=UPI001C10E5C9|nr:hypothetical protein [Geomonas azotofigens]MBU5613054.1 hypothetical protein [Geomonas azotofigens]
MKPTEGEIVLSTEDVVQVVAEIPKNHRHLRTTLELADGTAITLQEATVAAIVRAYVTVKTDPVRKSVKLSGRRLTERKSGYAAWQLLDQQE